MPLGFGSGTLYQTNIEPVSREAISVFADLGCGAFELGCFVADRVFRLDEIKEEDVASFEFLSMHGPAMGIEYRNNKETREILKHIEASHQKLNYGAVVIHPTTVIDWEVFQGFDVPFVVENMDFRWERWHMPEEYRKLVRDLGFGMVIDVQKAFTLDPTHTLSDNFYDEYQDALTHYQTSGSDRSSVPPHRPLHQTKQDDLILRIQDKNKPIIVESVFASPDDAKKEYEYIQNLLEQPANLQ